MKKRYLFLVTLAMTGIVFAQASKNDYIIIDQIAGKKVRSPIWAEKNLAMSDLEALNPDKYAFIIRRTGSNLDSLEMWVNTVSVSDVVGRQIAQHIIELAEEQPKNFKTPEFMNLMRTLAQITSKIRIEGLTREQEWWVLKQYRNKERRGVMEYTYSALYLIDKSSIDSIIALQTTRVLQGSAPELERNILNVLEKLADHQLSGELDGLDMP